MPGAQRHGAGFSGAITPDDVAGSLGRNDGGFGRAQETYFDHPVLQKAHWSWEIVAYFFIGGLAAGSSGIAMLARRGASEGERRLVRNARYAALAGAGVSSALLVADLGRPERFLKMLRIVKLKSPMSVGVYALLTFSASSSLEALAQLRADGAIPCNPLGFVPKPLRAVMQIASTALMASYTGVLLSATAIPVWYRGRRQIPAIFALSATATACALHNALLNLERPAPAVSRRLEVLETLAAAGEIALLLAYERASGIAGRPLFAGPRGNRLKTWTIGVGSVLPAVLALAGHRRRPAPERPNRLRPLVAAACALAGGIALRGSVVAAGRDSADDPRATLQRPR